MTFPFPFPIQSAALVDATAGQTFASSDSSVGNPIANLFDDNTAVDWFSGANNTGWVQVQFGSPKVIGRYAITSVAGAFDRTPLSWILQASNTGAFGGEEVALDTITTSVWGASQTRTFNIPNTTEYLYYRFNYLTKTDPLGKANEYGMAEMEMMAYV